MIFYKFSKKYRRLSNFMSQYTRSYSTVTFYRFSRPRTRPARFRCRGQLVTRLRLTFLIHAWPNDNFYTFARFLHDLTELVTRVFPALMWHNALLLVLLTVYDDSPFGFARVTLADTLVARHGRGPREKLQRMYRYSVSWRSRFASRCANLAIASFLQLPVSCVPPSCSYFNPLITASSRPYSKPDHSDI